MEKKKKDKRFLFILIIILIILALFSALIIIMRSQEDTWVCQNGQWVKHGNPKEPMPTEGCEDEELAVSENIRVFSPKPNEEISSPVEISGEAIGPWYFEADFPIELVDENGKSLAEGFVTAQGEWMTEDFVPFNGTLEFDPDEAKSGKLIFRKDNPSDLPELDEEFIVPVRFKALEQEAEKMTIKVFFSNTNLDPEVTCEKVFPV